MVSLTVEGGVSLVGPHCPRTVRLFCEGIELTFLGWTTSPIYPGPTNPAFVSVNITNVSFDEKILKANFSSVLTVDLLELNKQNIQNISCGDHLYIEMLSK